MAYRTRIFWFLAYRTRNVKFEATDLKRSCFGVWLIERGILHLERASCGLWLTEQGMLHLKHRAGRREPWERGCLLTLPKYLACYLEKVQKRALSIIWPGISYETALDKAVLSTLSDRRAVSCIKFIRKVRPGNPLYPLIPNSVITISTISVCLRSGSSSRPMATRTERFSNFVRVKYKCINLVNKCSVLVKKKNIYIYI